MKTLITGSDGQIGRELVELVKDHELLLIDKKSGTDLNDKRVQDKIAEFKPESVFHLAGSYERLEESKGFDEINWADNMLATQNLLGCVGNPKSFVFASSYLVYQAPMHHNDYAKASGAVPIYEAQPLDPRNLIGASKMWAERAIDFRLRDSLVSHARIFRVYSRESRCFLNTFALIKKNNGRANLYNPESVFDLIHAKDVAVALYCLMDSGARGTYNIGTGVGTRVQDIVMLMGLETVRALDHDSFERSYAATGKIKSLCGWEAKIKIADGVKELMA